MELDNINTEVSEILNEDVNNSDIMNVTTTYSGVITLYDELGEPAYYLDVSDYSAVYEALTAQNEKIDTYIALQAENNQYIGWLFALLVFFILYRLLSAALSAIFGGG